jgi:hypothetical protein
MMSDLVGLAVATHELTALTGKRAPGYRELYRMVTEGELSAVRVKGRWKVDLHKTAEDLGLIDKPAK